MIRKLLVGLLLSSFSCAFVFAQKPGAEIRIRSHTDAGFKTFLDSGAIELQRRIEFCYASASGAFNGSMAARSVERELANERCLAFDDLGLILSIAHKRMMESRYKKPFGDPFFNPEAQEIRVARHMEQQGLDDAQKKQFSDFVFKVVYDEFSLLSSKLRASEQTPASK